MRAQTPEELKQHFEDHLGFLRISAELYDRGNISEAKRLAVSIRVLVHDTTNSVSLLQQLGLKNRLFVDTATAPLQQDGIRTSHTGLIGTSIGGGAPEYVPHLDLEPHRTVAFEEWWNAPVILDMAQRQISRARLVLAVANKDGGAHVDPELDEIYAALSRENSLGRMRSRLRMAIDARPRTCVCTADRA